MIDLADIWADAKRSLPEALRREWFGRGAYLFRDCVGVLPGRVVGEHAWQPLPWRGSRARDTRVIVAVRGGQLRDALGDLWRASPPDPSDLAELGAIEGDSGIRPGEVGPFLWPASVELHPSAGIPTARGSRIADGWEALRGEEIFDLLACDLDMTRPPRSLLGIAGCLGVGAAGDGTDSDAGPVQLCRNVRDWLTLVFDRGSLPYGDAAGMQSHLRRFGGGIACRDLAHGVAIERLMRRDLPPPPPIFVDSGARHGAGATE